MSHYINPQYDDDQDPLEGRTALIQTQVSFHEITEQVCGAVENPNKVWWVFFLISLSMLGIFGISLLVIVHEAPRHIGPRAEIAATVAERGLLSLQAPIERVTAPDTIVPLPRLEKSYMPSEKHKVEAARRALNFA